jgi:hypothetical protein
VESFTDNLNTFRITQNLLDFLITVVETDYTSWALLYFCKNDLAETKNYAVILSRVNSLPDSKINEIKKIANDKLNLQIKEKIIQDSSYCSL